MSKSVTKIKVGNLMMYKKRIFRSNWRWAQITLYDKGRCLIESQSSSSQLLLRCEKESTLIIFGRQVKSVPKRPVLPSGYRIDQLLGLGIIEENLSTGSTAVIFYWFLTKTTDDLFDWTVALCDSIQLRACIPDDQEEQDQDLAVSLLMAGAAHLNNLAITQSVAQTTTMDASGDLCDAYGGDIGGGGGGGEINDCSFVHDFSICAGL